MKKILISLLALLWMIPVAQAVPAFPGTYRYRQPDGTVVVLRNHGDEFYNWTTDASGQTVEMDEKGFFRPVKVSASTHRARAREARAKARAARALWSSYENPFPTNFGDRKILCILAEFAPEVNYAGEEIFDGKYVLEDPRQHFADMLNKQGYDEDGAIGSVRDYFMDNSMNQYRPRFDVYGPVQLSKSSSYYDNNGVYLAILEAYDLLMDAPSFQLNIDDYDTDNDGEVDMVLFYYPGHNQAEGGPGWTIWPHQDADYFGDLGGKRFTRYFCTSELRGNSGTNAAAIGTTCHEFSHSLGLPDFYDVDYDNSGRNAFTTGDFDLMSDGNYNDAGRRPPYLTAVERNMLGWMEAPAVINTEGNHTLPGIQNNTAFRIDGRIPGEYFVLECRTGGAEGKWDTYLSDISATGLVLYQIDQSQRVVRNGYTAAYLWENTNNVNAYGGHPCYRIVQPVENYATPEQGCVFPGYNNVQTWEPTGWDGRSVGMKLTDISFDGSQVTFGTALTLGHIIDGYVKDGYGQPIENATVVMSVPSYEMQVSTLLSTDIVCQSDADGYYRFELSDDDSMFQVISVRKDGYVSQACNVMASERLFQQDFVLFRQGEIPSETLQKYDTSLGIMLFGDMGSSVGVGMRYSAEELSAMGVVGATISQVSFKLGANRRESIYLIIDLGQERTLINVTNQYSANQFVTVDISDHHLVIPEGQVVYIGVGVDNITSFSPFYAGFAEHNNGGSYVLDNFLVEGSNWRYSNQRYRHYYLNFLVSANLAWPVEMDFATQGVSYTKLVNGVPQVVPAAGKTVYRITWTLDGTPINGEPPSIETLSPGAHTFMSRIEYYDGTAERVYYDVTAN